MDLTKLTRERDQVRRVFNRHETTADSLVDLEFLKEKMEALALLDKTIHDEMLTSTEFDQQMYEKEYDECDCFRRKWLQVKTRLQNKGKKDEHCKPETDVKKHNLNLPKLEIRRFDDNPKSWLGFWGQFKKIHEEKNMDAETKFQYLTQAMTPDSKARSLVESYPPTEENYPKVIQTLKDRFAKDETLIEIYVRELLKLVTNKNQVPLDILFDRIVANLQILESLGIVRDKYECILLPLIESALPETTLLLWSKVPYTERESKLSNLLKFLQTEVEAERRVQLAKTEFLNCSSAKERVPTAACLVSETKQVKEKFGMSQPAKEGKEYCYFCEKCHNTLECGKANVLSLEEKKDAIKRKGGCYICLKKGHLAKNCKAFIKCMCCSKRHLLILCPTLHTQSKTCEQKIDKTEVATNFSSNRSTTLLQTLIVNISGGNQERKVRALLDSGSQRTYVKATLARELGLQVTDSESLSHSLFGGVKKATQTHRVLKFTVSNLDNTYITSMTGLEQDVLCGDLPRVQDIGLIKKLEKHQINLTDADQNLADIKDIDILIGSDYLGSILDNSLVHLTEKLVAVKTKLGWTLQGPIQSSSGICCNVVQTNFVTAIPDTNDSLEFLWNIETLGIKDPYNTEANDTCIEISVNDSGRYEVPLLWKERCPKVDSNYEAAQRRLYSTTKKLTKTERLEDYHNIIKEWIKEGIIELVEIDDKHDGHYLPHHAVIKLESTTTKIRPVMDASSKDRNGLSLNMCIEKGANLIEMIPKLIIRFRTGTYGVISDIKKAFLQISISPGDRMYLKLLWWNNHNTQDEVVTYKHARVPFGVACSPFLLAATINHHLMQYAHTYPETAARLRESFYVDNCVTSYDTKLEVQNFIKEATQLMHKGQFDLRGWMTNSSQEEEPVSVLGVQWDRHTDNLCCNIKLKAVPNDITKRNLLSITQQIFDPIGFLCPVSLVPKLIMQKAWLLKSGWDEKIPAELEEEYKNWIRNIDCLQKCRIPRRLTEFPLDKCQTTVHIFCDASKDAYAGCVFLRTEHEGQVTVRLIIAKSRVAPIKRQMTLPRLELMGALIASRLYLEVVNSGLLSACKSYKVYCWTDSAIVLAWLQRQDTWKEFVTNRVKEICTNTNKEDWNHLPGIFNVADLPSRGCNAKVLLETQWWTGPQWLYLKEEHWPKSAINNTQKEEESISSEQSKSTAVNVEITAENFSSNLLYFNQYIKIVRLVARLLRMSPRIRKEFNVTTEHIGSEEYKNAEMTLLRIIQKEHYKESKQKEENLITMEENEMIKVKTRLEHSINEDKEFIYPILLPGKHEIIQRMVRHKHVMLKHAGAQLMMSTLRNSYWVTGIRRLTKKVVAQCTMCKRYKAKHYEAPEPPLPVDRISSTTVFEITGVDLAGPLMLKDNKKCWIVLFTCAVYRAVHLELTESLSTASFIMALRRFIARRGRVRKIYSDNGTNFTKTSNLLQEVNWQEVETSTNSSNIIWKFSPPSAPWWGGWWERLIRVVKDMLRRILGKACVDWIELTTILCDCESVINNRPLTYVDMGEMKPLTPAMFLHGLPTNDTPDLDQIDQKLNVRYNYLQQLREDFRKRFRTEYLGLLVHRGKGKRNEPKVGEIVLIDTDTSRLHWPLGIIKDIFTGKDGCSRVARVQTASGVKLRASQKLYPLEISATSQETLDMIPQTSKSQLPNISEAEQQQMDVTPSMDTGPEGSEQNPSTVTTRCGREILGYSRFKKFLVMDSKEGFQNMLQTF